MGSQARRYVLIAVVGAAIIALVAVAGPYVSLWYAKRQAWEQIANRPLVHKATLNCVPVREVRRITTPLSGARRISCEVGGYRLSLPDAEFRPAADANDGFEGGKLTVHCAGIAPCLPEFSPQTQPSDESIRAYFRQADPYDLLVEAFRATPAGIRNQDSHVGLRKHLYLLLLKSARQPVGSEKLLECFETDRRKGVLAGDMTSESVIALVYLPETRDLAELVITKRNDDVRMSAVYRFLGLLKIDKAPAK